jgi:O-antigen ligase
VRSRPRVHPGIAGLVLFVVLVAAVQFSVALVAARRPGDALALVAGLVLLATAVLFPRALLILAPVATMFSQRVGPAALDLSVTDAVGLLALLAGLRFIPWRNRQVRLVLGALALYLAALSVTLIVHHPQRSVLELFHRGVLFGGTVLIGVAIVQAGVVRQALRLFMVGMSVLAVALIVESLRTGFEPAYVFQLQKNHSGILMAIGFLVALVATRQLAWSTRAVTVLRVLMLVGLVATQSRAAALGLVAALAVRPLLGGQSRNQKAASVGLLLICLVLLVFTAMSIQATDLSRPAAEQKFNSINSRTNVYEEAIQKVWLNNRFVGGGLKYFRDPERAFPTPHNIVIGELAEVGVIGLAGLSILLVATAVALRRARTDLAVLAMMAFVCRLTQGMADIYWVAGPLTIALLLVGMGLTPDPTDPGPDGSSQDDTTTKQTPSRLTAPRWSA